jgi:hypothetical protein
MHFRVPKDYTLHFFIARMLYGKVQENQIGQELNDTHQLLAYADDVKLLGDNIQKNTETLIDASMEVDLEIDVEKAKYTGSSTYDQLPF